MEHGQRKKNRQVKSFEVILAAAHHHLSIKMSCPKRGPAEKGQDPPPPPGPARTGTTRPAAAARLGARDDVRVSAADRRLNLQKKKMVLAFKHFTRP